MEVFKAFQNEAGMDIGFMFRCPGCIKHHEYLTGIHAVHVADRNVCGAQWSWNGNLYLPTLSPSVKETMRLDKDAATDMLYLHDSSVRDVGDYSYVCHFFIVDGKFNYCGDCSHAMAGMQGVPMLPWENN